MRAHTRQAFQIRPRANHDRGRGSARDVPGGIMFETGSERPVE